jgi:hypothetical protein
MTKMRNFDFEDGNTARQVLNSLHGRRSLKSGKPGPPAIQAGFLTKVLITRGASEYAAKIDVVLLLFLIACWQGYDDN